MSLAEKIWREAILPTDSSIEQVVRNLDYVAIKIVLIVNEAGVLQGTISDGDIRRGLLSGLNLNSPISSVINRNAVVVTSEMGRDMVMQLMAANKIQQVPVVDSSLRVVGLHLWDDITAPTVRPNVMVIMAGGGGTRLRPFTEHCPKPLLAVAGKPILEHIIERARLEGFQKFVLAIHYLGHMIENHFGNGHSLGVEITYLREEFPQGTAGALAMLRPQLEAPFVVTNGDVITDIRYGELLDFHVRHAATATMAIRLHEWQNPFGVVHLDGMEIVGFEEKPIARSHINAGVYALDPEALSSLSANAYCDMPSLFERLQLKALRTVAYPVHEQWIDVGRPSDLSLMDADYLS